MKNKVIVQFQKSEIYFQIRKSVSKGEKIFLIHAK